MLHEGAQTERERDMTKLTAILGDVARASEFIPSAHTVYLCVLCASENKQRLFPYTTLTDWFV